MRKLEEPETLNRADFCGKCSGNNVIASQRGYSAMTLGLCLLLTILTTFLSIISVPIFGLLLAFFVFIFGIIGSIITGAVGKGKVINMCANCGNKWEPGK